MKTTVRIFVLYFLFFCFNTITSGNLDKENKINFEYSENIRCIILNAIINDNLETKFMFDTGVYGLIIADTLSIYGEPKDSKIIKIGDIEKVYYDYPQGNLDYMTTRNPIFSALGIGGVIGWDFFDEKIIEISYKDKYIKFLDSLDNIPTCFQEVTMSKDGNKWGIEGIYFIHGRKIEEIVMIDTGNNSALTFNNNIIDKYEIDLSGVQEGMTSTAMLEGEKRLVTRADSILIGGKLFTDTNIAFRGIERRSPFAGLLGNIILQNFSIILDFKNSKCFLKKNDNQ